jgi:hypothetical protein
MAKLQLGSKQLDTLLEALDQAQGWIVDIEEFSSDYKRFKALEDSILNQLAKGK